MCISLAIADDDKLKSLTLSELISKQLMATICPQKEGYGIILVILTYDSNPPHFHVFKSNDSKCLCRYILTDDCPESLEDLIPMKGDKDLSKEDKLKILSWATNLHKRLESFTNWQYAKYAWKNEALKLECFPTIAEAKLGL